MSTQPETLRLADELVSPLGTQSTYSAMQEAAAELRRLHGLEQQCEALLQQQDLYQNKMRRLQAKNEALRTDAERYRYLRKKVCIIGTDHLSYTKAIFDFVNLPYPRYIASDASIELDAAVDAARSKA